MKISFPQSFIFGVAEADLQVIGEENTLKYENSELSVWDYFGRTSPNAVDNDTPAKGVNRYHLWQEDTDLMQELGIKHYRSSISMARTLKRNGDINPVAIYWYKKHFKALKKAGIKSYMTLYHQELPYYLHEIGGWTNEKTIAMLVRHAEVVYEELGEYIEEYFILNEPWVTAIRGYYIGEGAPGGHNLSDALLAGHNLLLAQGIIYEKLRARDPKLKISTVINVQSAYAASTNKKDLLAANYLDGSINRWFLDPLYLGSYPEDMVEFYGKHMPKFGKADMKVMQVGDKLHALGVNYYLSSIVTYNAQKDFKFSPIFKKGSTFNDLGWVNFTPPLYPEGLSDIMSELYFTYKSYGLKRLYVTENGTALSTPWDHTSKVIDDQKRIDYLTDHVQQVHNAILRGVPIEGYFHWTLMDNYEWQRGYRADSNFGLYHVNFETMKRVPKKSAQWYKKLITTGELTI